MIYMFGGIVTVLSLAARFMGRAPAVSLFATGAMIFVIAVLLYINNHYNVYNISAVIMVVLLGDVFLPAIFLRPAV
jgi:low affinity Fe/Cu permease